LGKRDLRGLVVRTEFLLGRRGQHGSDRAAHSLPLRHALQFFYKLYLARKGGALAPSEQTVLNNPAAQPAQMVDA
jgi:hypothetical protein